MEEERIVSFGGSVVAVEESLRLFLGMIENSRDRDRSNADISSFSADQIIRVLDYTVSAWGF